MKELSTDERIEWFEATLKECSSNVNTLNGEEFLNVLFEDLCIDVVSCFSEYGLGILVDAGVISERDKNMCLMIKDLFVSSENEFLACGEADRIKATKQWKEINNIADDLWDNYFLSKRPN